MTEDDTRTLHVAVDRDNRTWRLLEREDGTLCIYYSTADDPPHAKRVVWDTADQWTDPPRVLRARAERAEVRMSEMQYRIADLIAALNDYGQHTQPCTGRPCTCGLALAMKG